MDGKADGGATIVSYLDETEELFLPMLRRARRAFPAQGPAYENAELMLNSQLTLLRAVVAAQSEEVVRT